MILKCLVKCFVNNKGKNGKIILVGNNSSTEMFDEHLLLELKVERLGLTII